MLSGLETKLLEFGLHLRGAFGISDEEMDMFELSDRATITLVGNIGSSYWPVFSESAEYQDGLPDSLDRWSKRVAEQVENGFGVKAIYPFEGPPYFPFQQWAKRAEPLNQSPLGLMIHPLYGLWHSYRFALLIPGDGLAGQQAVNTHSPCASCDTQPCLQTCPVGAFDINGYDVASCATFLKQSPGASCHGEGCLARLACPVGESYQYDSDQHCFHLRAFLMNA
jgi:epoxyqueuosine reductase QueG